MAWAKRMGDWNQKSFGRHTKRIRRRGEDNVATQVIRDLVAWSDEPPKAVRQRFPEATFGLAGIAKYAEDCGNMEEYEDWGICHGINPQWTIRNSTAHCLRLAADFFPGAIGGYVRSAADHYRAAFVDWQEFYELLGHHAPEGAGKDPERRALGHELALDWLEHETYAIEELKRVPELIEHYRLRRKRERDRQRELDDLRPPER